MASKYNARRVTIDGIAFASAHEGERYQALKLMQKAGKISNLRLQVPFELIPAQYEYYARYGENGKRLKDGRRCLEKSCTYVADFTYTEDGHYIVEDAKGYKGSVAYEIFAIKRKLMLERNGIRVRET